MLLDSSKGRIGERKACVIKPSLTVPMADITNQSQNSTLMSLTGGFSILAPGHCQMTRAGILGEP